nr:retrotransposon protein, putative, Ty1-copia subclass [Tanacetum cinerariifolium]
MNPGKLGAAPDSLRGLGSLKIALRFVLVDRYQYEDNVDPEKARYVWEERAKRRFRGLWGAVRRNCKKKTSSTNPAHSRLVCPDFVNKEDWDGILASWMTEKWKKRSAAAGVANRKIVPWDEEGSYVRHTGGCVSFEIHCTRWLHWVAVKHILKYLRNTKDMFLVYGGNPNTELEVIDFCDASWQCDKGDTKSQTGYVFVVNGGAVDWKSKKQTTIAMHAMQSEYMAVSEAAMEAVWIRKFVGDLRV